MPEDSITITVSGKENVDWIRSKVRDGEFASEEDAVDHSIALLREHDGELEAWMRDQVAQRYDELKLDPEIAVPIDQVVKNLEERRRSRAQQSR